LPKLLSRPSENSSIATDVSSRPLAPSSHVIAVC